MTPPDRPPASDGRPSFSEWLRGKPFTRAFLLLWGTGAVISFFGVVLDSGAAFAVGDWLRRAAWLAVAAAVVWSVVDHRRRRQESRRARP